MFAVPDWPAWAIRLFITLGGVTLSVALVQRNRDKAESVSSSDAKPKGDKVPAFRAFQRQYLVVYSIIMMADWLQGTNMYTLYSSYDVNISSLFITGFTSSAIFGTIVGLYVDKWGRKFGCIIYLIIEVVVNVFEHFNNMPLLLFGRFLGGISTSLLFSAFESWMVSAHRKKGFPEEWLADTFGTASFINGISAIIAGLVAQLFADHLGEIGPFQAAIALTILALFFVVLWEENYGSTDDDNKDKKGEEQQSGLQVIMNDKKVFLTGAVNALFEGSMYSFVFMWVPTMLGALKGSPLPTGLVFSSLMCCISLGGILFSPSMLLSVMTAEQCGVGIFLVGALSLCVPVFCENWLLIILSFCVFETCVGTFFPCAGTLRSKVIPDAVQGSVMNIFRIPLNIFVVVGTKLTDWYSTSFCFSIVISWLLLGAVCQMMLIGAVNEGNKSSKKA